MKKSYLCLFALVLATSCEKVDPGDPPADPVFRVAGLSESQLQVSWDPGQDDLLEPANLAFAIWLASGDEVVDPESTPTLVTEEGALSYTFTELEAQTTYDVLVRTEDRFRDRSTNETTRSAATLASGGGRFAAETEVTFDSTPSGMVVGKAFQAGSDDLGVIFSDTLRWFKVENGVYTLSDDAVFHSENILEAHLIPTSEMDLVLDDLFVLSNSNLFYYAKVNVDPVESITPFQGPPRAGSLGFFFADSHLELLTFVNDNGRGSIYTSQTDDNDEPFVLETTYDLGDRDASFKLGHFDGDEFHDLVSLVDNTVRLAIGLEGFEFGSETVIDTIEDDEVGPGPFDGGEITHSLFVDQTDVFIFFRNATEDVTKLFIYRGDGQGDFAEPVITDYDHHFYEMPSFQINDAGTYDFIAPQSSSNNVAIYSPSANYGGLPQYYGVLGTPDQALYADIGAIDGRDLIVLTIEDRKVTVLRAN